MAAGQQRQAVGHQDRAPLSAAAQHRDFTKTDSNFIVRNDTGTILSTKGPEYAPISNADYGAVIEQVMEAHNLDLKYETTVILRGGRTDRHHDVAAGGPGGQG